MSPATCLFYADERGWRLLPGANPCGNYELRFEAKGFATSVRPKFELVLNQTARVDVQMIVGAMTQSVEVSSERPAEDGFCAVGHGQLMGHECGSSPGPLATTIN